MSKAVSETLRAFYAGHRQQLYTYAVSITRQREAAEDAIQRAFQQLLSRNALPTDLRPYVFRCVRNAALDGLRRDQTRQESIFANDGMGIGVYSGANNSAAAPSLSSAVLGMSTVISGGLSSLPATTFHLDFYANSPGAAAQARTYLGSQDAVTSQSGALSFTATLAPRVPTGWTLTATATDPAGNTSPLSPGITVTTTDSAGDGIPDVWRQTYFGSAASTNGQSCAGCDADHDGLSNWQEFLAGTNPTNSASVLQIGPITRVGSDIQIGFLSSSGIVYRVEVRADLSEGSWSTLADEIPGTGGTLLFTEPGVATLAERFYRVDVLP